MNLTRILAHIPDIIKIVENAGKAATGDPQAQEYMRKDAGYDAIDIALHRGAGGAARGVVEGVKILLSGEGAEPTDLGSLPWSGFVKRLYAQESGGHILLGQMGTGKTTLAVKLAWQWNNHLGYPVEWVGFYPEDVPNFGGKAHFSTLIHRMGCLASYLKSQGVKDEDEDLDDEDGKQPKYPAKLPPKRRIVVIDEMGMAVTRKGITAEREAVLRYLAECRHVSSLVVFLAQYASQIPLNVIGQSTIWVKKPTGSEKETDRDNPLVRQCWEEAETAFGGLRRSGWQVPPHQDVRSWAYVHCPSLSGKPGYKGMLPFTPYDPKATPPPVTIEGEFKVVSDEAVPPGKTG